MTAEHTENELSESILIEETLSWLNTRCFNEPISEAITNITGYRVSGKNIIAPDGTQAEFSKDKVFKRIKHLTPAQKRNAQRVIKNSFETKFAPDMTAYNTSRNELYMASTDGLYMIRIYESRSGRQLLMDLYKAEFDKVITFKLVTTRNPARKKAE